MKKPILLFDYDGTIHETLKIYEPAMRHAFSWLLSEHKIRVPDVSREEIGSWLGLNSVNVWNAFMPDMLDELKGEVSTVVARGMAELVLKGESSWYEGVYEQLCALKKAGYTMLILSNCRTTYRAAHMQAFPINTLFDAFYDCESYGFIPKTEIFKEISRDFPGEYISIGDRAGDIAIAAKNGFASVGCAYGSCKPGELKEADAIISTPSELINAIQKIQVK